MRTRFLLRSPSDSRTTFARLLFRKALGLAACALCLGFLLTAQEPHRPGQDLPPPEEDVRLPGGKLQRDEILRADHEKSIQESRELAKLAEELKTDLEKSDRYVLSLQTLKKTEEIEKLAKRIHDRLKRF